ncbi:uncharacterized protein PFL1_04019 [Pseudozyma flocculosa PF-1]|uniref:MIP18 family-like domain-containing protein n=2 Tax=Pseudozyma flocculosa TaxID=84751 RepID=A0A5C3EUV6_9BASI|nr:uncharacterized protein PFL1_04019 [Pseudozyma flocculosa PF-1]EPQ28191.1 hypothetical protein PFL1_04019 [Pseudozyma flocculosa PF-1]SPO35326.1 uncharacterized protein PSFLO_00797 [Pseudozyma flocculosa]
MASKDNANPIIYTPSSSSQLASNRDSAHAAAAGAQEWWRDPSVHSSASSSAALANDTLAFSVDSPNDDDDADDDDDVDDGNGLHGDDLDHGIVSGAPPRNTGDHIQLPESVGGKLGTGLDTAAAARNHEELIDSQEVYDLIRSITDPEHPLTLEQLAVVNASHIVVEQGDAAANKLPHVLLEFTPTIPHCSMATLIGLSLRVRLLRALPPRFKVDIRVRPGTHQSENAVNKQLNDKERVAAALENAHLLDVVQGCLASAARRGKTEDDVRRELDQGGAGPGHEVWKTVEEVAKRLGVEA